MNSALLFCNGTGRRFRGSKIFVTRARTTCRMRMSSAGASPVRTSASLENGRVFEMAHDLVFGSSWRALLGRYDPASSCLKTLQPSLLPEVEGLELLPTLPKWGMTRAGELFERPTPERHTNGRGGGAWPTIANQEPGWQNITVVDKDGNTPTHPNQRFYDADTGRLVQKGLTQVAAMAWPTPQAFDSTEIVRDTEALNRAKQKGGSRNLREEVHQNWATPAHRDYRDGSHNNVDRKVFGSKGLPEQNQGKLNPDWVETLMGFPIGWTLPNGPQDQDTHNTPGNHRAQLLQENTARIVSRRSVTRLCRKSFTRWH